MKNNHSSNQPIQILLIGTSDFAVPIFESIANDQRFYIVGVITQPDKPAGRKKELKESPVKEWAKAQAIVPQQPDSLKDGSIDDQIQKMNPDIALVVAYGKLIPEHILNMPQCGTANVHPSLLPEYRGPAPIQYAILKGNKKTGTSVMLIDEQMDHGPLLTQMEYTLHGNETYQELSDTLSRLSANIVPESLALYINGTLKPVEQNHNKATFTKMITTNDGSLFWEKPAIELERRIRALNPEPGTYCMVNGKRLKIKNVRNIGRNGKPGEFFEHEGSLAVQTGEDALVLDEVQPEGKKWMTGEQYLNGYGLPNKLDV